MSIEIKTMQLADIKADYDWNCRSKVRAQFDGTTPDKVDEDGETPGISGLADSLEIKGQDTEVDVREVRDPKDAKKVTIHLVTGFRRYTAACKLRDGKDKKTIMGLPHGAIRVKNHGVMSEEEARSLNLRENVNRQNLIGPDLAYGIKMLCKANPSLEGKQVAAAMGKSTSYCLGIMAMNKTLDPKVFTKWREAGTRVVPVAKMFEAVKAKGTQAATADWVEQAKIKANKLGKFLGELALGGFVTVNASFHDVDGKGGGAIRNFVSFKTKTDKGEVVGKNVEREVAKAFEAGYKLGLTPVEKKDKPEAKEDHTTAAHAPS